MSTNATISVIKDGFINTIYLHWDGYLAKTGMLLFQKYTTYEQACAIVELGDCSSLEESIECPKGHEFDNRAPGYSVFYNRDRGEAWESVKPRKHNSITQAVKCYDCKYNYIFIGGDWYVTGNGENIDKLSKKL